MSGMNFSADTGDLWFFDVKKHELRQVNLTNENVTIFRTNGIELSPDDTELFVTSAENNADFSIKSAKIIRFDIDRSTRLPTNPRVALDIPAVLLSQGVNPMGQADPDGMRFDIVGSLFMTLNGFGRVLKWNIHSDPCTAEIIELDSVASPSNLEFAGKEGKELFIIGQC